MGSAAERVKQVKQVIWKQELPIRDVVYLDIPFMSDVLHVAEQDRQLCVWFLCDPDQRPSCRRFHIVGTGHPVPDEAGVHIGTVPMSNGLVWHVFDSISEMPDSMIEKVPA